MCLSASRSTIRELIFTHLTCYVYKSDGVWSRVKIEALLKLTRAQKPIVYKDLPSYSCI